MTESNGSGESGNSGEGTTSLGSGSGATQGDGGAADNNGSNGSSNDTAWLAGLSEDNRSLVDAKGWSGKPDINPILDSYRNAEAQLGKALVPPGDDASDEDHEAFYAKLGRPEKPDGYQFKMPDGLPEDFAYSDELAKEFKDWAHAEGLSPRQAQRLHDRFVGQQAAAWTAHAEETGASARAAHEAIIEAWGEPGTEKHTEHKAYADAAITGLPPEFKAALVKGGLMTEEGIVLDPAIAMTTEQIGRGMFAESALLTGGKVSENPWVEGEGWNLTKQGEIVREDPERARLLITQAGKDPAIYKL